MLGAKFNGIAVDPNTTNLFVTGSFTGSVDFGLGAITTPWGGNGGFFVAAYNASGTINLWTRAYGVSGDVGSAIAVDASGNLALTGYGVGDTDFLGNGMPTSGGGWFVANFTTSGAFRWAQRVANRSGGGGVAYDSLGHLLVGGWLGAYGSTFDFGGISITGQSPGDGFVVQYTK